jgi:pilus assembly protein TadC
LVVWFARLSTQRSMRLDALPRRVVRTQAKARRSLLQEIGRRVMRVSILRRIPADISLHRNVGAGVVVCPVVAVVSLRSALILGVLFIGVPVARARQQKALRRRVIERDLPMIIDLLHLGVQSGLTIGATLAYVAKTIESPVCDVFRVGLRQLDQGRRLSDVLTYCEQELGDEALALTSALQSAERYGSPLSETLAQLVRETRFDQERRSEQVARRLSVQLLFPVAGCILPAFALLTAAPLIAGSVGTLASSFH